jgi:hypothetical protein
MRRYVLSDSAGTLVAAAEEQDEMEARARYLIANHRYDLLYLHVVKDDGVTSRLAIYGQDPKRVDAAEAVRLLPHVRSRLSPLAERALV